MANVKISALPVVTSLNSTDILPVVAGTATSQITLQNLSSTLLTVNSASYALTASYALNGGGGVGSVATSGSTLYSTDPVAGPSFSTVNSIFLGNSAGYQAQYASGSNFLGYNAGYGASRAYNSNMLGYDAGYNAYSASNSNFFGQQAGDQAFNAKNSNFFGYYAGKGAVFSEYSNFLGFEAGYNSYSPYSNFLGYQAGYFTNATDSNFFGEGAGYQANANNSNFIGLYAGGYASNASYSNLFGYKVGYNLYNTNGIGPNNIIIGTNITLEDDRADSINLGGIIFATGSYNDPNTDPFSGSLGNGKVGINVVNPTTALHVSGTVSASAFIGDGSGLTNIAGGGGSVSTNGSTLYSTNPSTGGSFNTNGSIFLGTSASYQATDANNSNFLGYQAGYQATYANYSNFLGYQAGYGADFANSFEGYSNFIGYGAGYQASNAPYANFIGDAAGGSATNAEASNFLGKYAGQNATNAAASNFIGINAGKDAINADNSNFLGQSAGISATNAKGSNFFGNAAGYSATTASNSNFFGRAAGYYAYSASYSTLIGYHAGYNDVPSPDTSIGSNNIIIGTNITVSSSRKDSINIGGILFGTGSYSNTTGNAFSGSAGGKIGINVPNPSYNLEVSGSVSMNGFVVLTQVSQSLNFANDAAAAAGGVPLGGLYRNSNAIQIRLA